MMEHLAEQGVVHADLRFGRRDLCGVITIPRPSSPSLPRWSVPASAASANWASRSTGSSTPCATLPSRKPSGSSSRPPKLRPLYPSIIGIGLGGDERHTGSAPFRRSLCRSRASRPPPHQPRRRNHRPRSHLGGALHRLGAHRPCAFRHPGPCTRRRAESARARPGANPTSNVRTGVCPSFAAHPLRRYFDAGLLVTLNSDDPAFFGSDLANEYLLAHTMQGFTREELRQLAANSIRASFLSEPEKAAWISRIDSSSK